MSPKLTEAEEQLVKTLVTPEFPKNPYEVLGELDFKEPQVIPRSKVGTPVQEFYRDATVFVTGGTGFLGKTLIEKLLRSCPHVKHIFISTREEGKIRPSTDRRHFRGPGKRFSSSTIYVHIFGILL